MPGRHIGCDNGWRCRFALAQTCKGNPPRSGFCIARPLEQGEGKGKVCRQMNNKGKKNIKKKNEKE
jgi:hypothetical protein